MRDINASDAAERRRYALLRAATEFYWRGHELQVDDWSYGIAVQEANKLLAEIERRESEEREK